MSTLVQAAMIVCLLLPAGAALAQTPQDAVQQAVANSGAFPSGTSVLSVTIDAGSAVVDLSPEAAPAELDEAQAADMDAAIRHALDGWPEITSLTVTVASKPLADYLPVIAPVNPEASGPMMLAMAATVGGELAGKKIAVDPRRGSYWNEGFGIWFRAMGIESGPCPATNVPPIWGTSVDLHPSDYYYWTKGYQWNPFFDDDLVLWVSRFLAAYLRSAGAEVYCTRQEDMSAGDFDYATYGYPKCTPPHYEDCSFDLPLWQVASKYNLQDQGLDPSIWDSDCGIWYCNRQVDKDLRARLNLAAYKACDVIYCLHTDFYGFGTRTGTRAVYSTYRHPALGPDIIRLANEVVDHVPAGINRLFDDTYGKQMYPYSGTTPPEWQLPGGSVPPYPGYTGWQSRGTYLDQSTYVVLRDSMMPSVACEIGMFDDWKFFPDNIFMQDQIWQAAAGWACYESLCGYFGATPRPAVAGTLLSISLPAQVVAGQTFTATAKVQNDGMSWCWGKKFDPATMTYDPYTVWKIAGIGAGNPFEGMDLPIGQDDVIGPGETREVTLQLTAPTACGTFETQWQMLKDDAKGGPFGDVVTATAPITIGAPPTVTIGSPGPADYPYGWIDVAFTIDDPCGNGTVDAELDGTPVFDGETVWGLDLGSHTLVVTATNAFGSNSQSVTFNVVNTIGKTTVGGWIELLRKKANCSVSSTYMDGSAAPTGSMSYMDHDTNMTVYSTELIAMGIRDNKASIHGNCTINGAAGHWFRIDVVDNGTPGSNDWFDIYLDTGYHVGDNLGGGNVDIH